MSVKMMLLYKFTYENFSLIYLHINDKFAHIYISKKYLLPNQIVNCQFKTYPNTVLVYLVHLDFQ